MNTDHIIDKHLNEGYRIDFILEHNDILPFVKRNINTSNLLTILFYIIVVFGSLILLSYSIYFSYTFGIWHVFKSVCLGILSTILLIPIHEGIHAIAYMLCGAKSVQFGANWKQLYFTASAHHFVTGYKELFIVGLLPFLVINLSGFFLITYISETYSLGIISCLVLHNIMCAGDFGILSYFFQNRSLEPLTFDDVSTGKTYFMVKGHN